MAAVDQIGQTLLVGAGTISAGSGSGVYIVTSRTNSDYDVAFEDIDDEDGALATRIILKRHEKLTLDLVCGIAAAPQTDFPVGSIAAHSDFNTWYVESLSVVKSGNAQRATVNLTNIGISA